MESKKLEEIPQPTTDLILVKNAVPYQLCPKCNGQGIVSKPPHIAGDVYGRVLSTSASFVCNVCNGMKIIPMCAIQQGDNNFLEK